MYYPCSENKGTDQLRGYREADLRLCFRKCKKPVFSQRGSHHNMYCKAPKFSDTRKLCCNQPIIIQTKKPNLTVFRQKNASGIANSEDSYQTAPL